MNVKNIIAKIFNIKVKSDCPEGLCLYDAESRIYKIRGKKYSVEFFNILGSKYCSDYIFRVDIRKDGAYTIKKLPLQ